MNPLVQEFTVGCSPEHAFSVWAERTSLITFSRRANVAAAGAG